MFCYLVSHHDHPVLVMLLRNVTPVLLIQFTSCSGSLPANMQSHTVFPTVVAAVTAAANRYNPISIREDREFMGTVYRVGDEYGYTLSSGRNGSGASEIHLRRAALGDVVAFWHTHGRKHPAHAFFSHSDTEVVNELGLPMYLADHTGVLKVYAPGGRMASRFTAVSAGAAGNAKLASGKRVYDHKDQLVRVKTRRASTVSQRYPHAEPPRVSRHGNPDIHKLEQGKSRS